MAKRICVNCGSSKTIEIHHTSYKPPATIFLCRKCHQEIHNTLPVEGRLVDLVRQHMFYNKLIVILKNWKKSWEKQFECFENEYINAFIKETDKNKYKLEKEFKYELQEKSKLCDLWEGVGIVSLAYIVAFADPDRFPSLRKFLVYCGRKQSSKITKKYNRKMSSMAYQISRCLIRIKNKKYYPLYIKIKSEVSGEKGARHGKALNRISTLWLKDFFEQYKNLNNPWNNNYRAKEDAEKKEI